jgi:hypothetical protein
MEVRQLCLIQYEYLILALSIILAVAQVDVFLDDDDGMLTACRSVSIYPLNPGQT